MSQNDFNLANQDFPNMRADMNSAFQALASNSAGATAPSTSYPHQWWYDATTDILKMRNAGNTAWVNIAAFDQAGGTWAPFVGAIDLTGLTATAAELNILDGVIATAAQINKSSTIADNAPGSAPIYACRAWVNFDGTTTTPTTRASGNVSSVTLSGSADYTVNFTTAMPDANYSVCGLANSPGVQSGGLVATTRSTSSVVVVPISGSFNTVFQASFVDVVIFR
jgi:hypothetical protein